MISDLNIKGHVRIYKDGVLTQEADNTITSVGKGLILDLLANKDSTRCTYFEVGAGGRETLDVNNVSGGQSGTAFGTETYAQVAQSFYPATGTISRVVIKTLTTSGTNNNTMICQLFNTSGTNEGNPSGTVIPTGTALTSQYCSSSYWKPGSELCFDINTTVKVGSRYAIVLRNSGTTLDADTNYFNVAKFTEETYTSGNFAVYSGTAWTQAGSSDLYFKVYYPNSDGSPNAKTVSTSGLVIPTLEKAITSSVRSGTNVTFVCDITSVQANIPGKLSEARLMTGTAGSTIAAVSFRDEDKTEENELQINWDITLV